MQLRYSSSLLRLLRGQFALTAFLLAAVFSLNSRSEVRADVPFEFKQNDVVAIYGNGLADRMQHDPWVETVLQAKLKGKNVRFRNMSFSGDIVNQRPRNKGFTNDTEYLQHVAPTVVWIMYGYNESHAGPSGASAYKDELVKLVEKYRALRKEKGVDARFVLFSPIAYENTHNPHLPDGRTLNANLKAYTQATKNAADAVDATFVDLYTPTLKLYEKVDSQLTLNGIHLNAKGYRELADVIAKKLIGETVAKDASLSLIYDAVADKNWHWHNRYRATDGNDIWGSRSTLSFVDGQTNADVLVHELKMLDTMSANRDLVIWAAAAGKSIKPDDTNVPAPVAVKTNVGGGSRSSSAAKEGSPDYLSPEESLKKIKVPDGFELNIFASEEMFPDLANPVQLQVDSKGRLWAASWNSYPKWQPGDELKDSLMIFEDTDRDGVADKRKIFAHVHNPLGFEFWGGGVLVTSGPDLLFLKDTDGDDKADVRYPILQGLGTSDTHHAANNLIYGPDGGIYWQSGIFLVHNHETPWKQNLHTGGSGMYRFDPRTFAITPVAANSPNPHGISFDRWGYLYANDGTGGRSYQVRPKGNGFQMHSLLEKEFRPVPANAILSSTHFPKDMQQDFLILNVIGFLGVKQYDLDRGDGGKREYGHVWGTPVQELLSGEDRNFRPSDAIVGEDGALYVADWHNVIIGHMQHNIRDPSRDHKHGRILRLTVKGRPLQEPVAIDGEPIEHLLENLKHPVDGVRQRTRIELSTRDSDAVIAAAQAWAKDFDPNDETEAHHLLEALWLHQQHNVVNQELLDKLLNSEVPHAAVAANTVQHFWTKFDTKLATDFAAPPELHVVNYRVPRHLKRKFHNSYKRGSQIFQRESHCATCHLTSGQGNGVVYPPLVGSPWVNGSEERLIKLALHGMWGKMQVRGKVYDPARGVPPMTAFRDLLNDKDMADVLTFVRNTWGNKATPIDAATVAKVRAETANRTIFWKPEELTKLHPLERELMAKEDLTAPEVVDNRELEKELLAAAPEDLANEAWESGNARRGKRLFYTSAASCFACHDPPGSAPKLGPDLTKITKPMMPVGWVNAVLHPSQKIDKAFAQVNVLTVEGKVITGIRISEDDKGIVLRNLAAPKPITIPRDSVDEVFESKTSMMPNGLVRSLKSRREFNDLMKYLISLKK
ncbi:PVC-type heme-binding CxxCH protein [Thalassoroseus pseudoceratinae]|uniref:PVC-type heme-binding CxxCH protein n=1 Tax=Thalassoroseus pseudoceratinae TaxID=2713176 RepID=UPI0014215FB6|nr:PVC-type heme-binding CxxCH protein [Thalassoroseus pseudoceratinae]